ncbi:acetoacetyl-CoA synthetase, partial [Trichonephila clavata]
MPVTVHNPSIISELSPDILTGKSKNLKQAKIESNHLVWNKKVPDTELEKFKKIIEEKYSLKFDPLHRERAHDSELREVMKKKMETDEDLKILARIRSKERMLATRKRRKKEQVKQSETYWDLHSWSVTNFPNFWEEVWNYMGIVTSKPHDEVFSKSGPGFLDNQWFKGAAFNYAENILRIRDNREALLCLDEEGNFEKVTFAEMFQEVELYAAAFRKHGLQKGDTVA